MKDIQSEVLALKPSKNDDLVKHVQDLLHHGFKPQLQQDPIQDLPELTITEGKNVYKIMKYRDNSLFVDFLKDGVRTEGEQFNKGSLSSKYVYSPNHTFQQKFDNKDRLTATFDYNFLPGGGVFTQHQTFDGSGKPKQFDSHTSEPMKMPGHYEEKYFTSHGAKF